MRVMLTINIISPPPPPPPTHTHMHSHQSVRPPTCMSCGDYILFQLMVILSLLVLMVSMADRFESEPLPAYLGGFYSWP